MIEVETRALINDPALVKQKLELLGFIAGEVREQLDVLFDRPDGSLFKSGQKLRIRLEGTKTTLTFKGAFENIEQVSRREEINIPIERDSVTHFSAVFEGLGFPFCFQIPKQRQDFKRGNVTVSFDDWPIIGCLIEIEGAQESILQLAAQIAPGVEFRNFRLKELFDRFEKASGRSLAELQREYEQVHGIKLGRLDLIIK